MQALFNQYSYPLIGLLLIVGLFALLRLRRVRIRPALAASAALTLTLILVWVIARPGDGDTDDLRAAEAMLSSGRPTFVEFFSNYCLGCVTARPIVDALVPQIRDRFNILRVDIHTDVGRILRERYDFSYSPEFILFDAAGSEVWRSHTPPTAEQIALAAGENPAAAGSSS